MGTDEVAALVSGLLNANNEAAYTCLQALLNRSETGNSVYQFFSAFVDMLGNTNSYVRTRGLVLISANAKWDDDKRIDGIIDNYLSHIEDDKPITSRQCIKGLHKIAQHKPNLIAAMCAALNNASAERYSDGMRSLVSNDINAALEMLSCLHPD